MYETIFRLVTMLLVTVLCWLISRRDWQIFKRVTPDRHLDTFRKILLAGDLTKAMKWRHAFALDTSIGDAVLELSQAKDAAALDAAVTKTQAACATQLQVAEPINLKVFCYVLVYAALICLPWETIGPGPKNVFTLLTSAAIMAIALASHLVIRRRVLRHCRDLSKEVVDWRDAAERNMR